ncbi:hypothetical protein, conserved, partial [Eimeria acervulina]
GKEIGAEVQFIVDNLEDSRMFQKCGGRGYETFKCERYKFRVAKNQRVSQGDTPPVIGIGRINLGKVNLQTCIDYLLKPENKMQFDSSTNKVFTMETGEDFSIVYQSFKGQWGFSGREFVIACWSIEVDANRTILCCESIDWDEEIDGRVPDLVRGTLQIAG